MSKRSRFRRRRAANRELARIGRKIGDLPVAPPDSDHGKGWDPEKWDRVGFVMADGRSSPFAAGPVAVYVGKKEA